MPLLDNFRAARWIRTTNLLLQAVLLLTLFAGINYLADNFLAENSYGHYDLTRYSRYSLSAETLAYLKDLSSPVAITVTADRSTVSQEVRGLLREYVYATEPNGDRGVSVEYVDIDANRHRAEELGADQSNMLLVRCGDRRQALSMDELYQIKDGERRAFQGEQTITSAILDVSGSGRKKIYFLVGQGELRPDDTDPARGLSQAREVLRQRNFEVATLDLNSTRQIPPDASLLVAVAPRSPYSSFEQELLRHYLSADAGRLILFLAPGTHPALDALLLDWGVVVDDDWLRDTGTANMTENGDLIIGNIRPHPITQSLINYGLTLRVGSARTVRQDPSRASGEELDVRVLAASSPTAWGEVSYGMREAENSFTPGVDIRPPPERAADGLSIAASSERVDTRDNLPFSVPRGRMVVFGVGDLIANLRIADAGAEDVFLGSVNWAVDRDTQLSIRPRPIDQFQLSLSARELSQLRFCLLFGLPAAAAVAGLMVHWVRRT
jgi:hypothetical protein